MPRTLSKLTLLGLAGTALVACKAADPDATSLTPQPAMWVVSDADSEITLYPTIHVLPEGINWKSPDMRARLDAAEEVWFELPLGADQDPAVMQMISQYAMDPKTPLSAKVDADTVEKLKSVTADLGVPYAAVEQMQPWMAATMLSMMALQAEGFDPAQGVENQLKPMVAGKTTRALETAEQQIKMLATLPEDVQIAFLKESLEDMDEGAQMLRDMADNWAEGDIASIEDEIIGETKRSSPALYDAMFTQRNRNWTEQIILELEGEGTDFIAVGAGHLIGEDSVPAMLRAKGYTVKRL